MGFKAVNLNFSNVQTNLSSCKRKESSPNILLRAAKFCDTSVALYHAKLKRKPSEVHGNFDQV